MLALADSISVRDTTSFQIAKSMGFERKTTLSFDLSVLLLDSVALPKKRGSAAQASDAVSFKTIGVAILPFFELHADDEITDAFLVQRIAEALNQWLEKDQKNLVRLFIAKGATKDHDVFITDLLYASLTPQERVRLVPYEPDPRKVLLQIAQCDVFFGMRYHSCVFAYLLRLPLLVVNYFHKCQALAEDIKLPQSGLITPDEILNGLLNERLALLDTCPGSFMAELPPHKARKMAARNFSGGLNPLANLDDD